MLLGIGAEVDTFFQIGHRPHCGRPNDASTDDTTDAAKQSMHKKHYHRHYMSRLGKSAWQKNEANAHANCYMKLHCFIAPKFSVSEKAKYDLMR
jgi:hypothetical protein